MAFFVLAAPFARVDRARQVRTAVTSVLAAGGVVAAMLTLPVAVRLWMPFLYIAVGYWIPVPLVGYVDGGSFESSLRRTDAAARRIGCAPPAWLTPALELGYLACFPLVPIAFAAVSIAGSVADVARFWAAVLTAGLVCYGTLPWLVSRPPRLLESTLVASRARSIRLNLFVLHRVSHHLNTFPSGHVAVSVAGALSVARVWPEAGAVLGVVAAGVATGAVTGRYHYVPDVILGAILGIVVTLG
jgi:membrane-associated phospholipid phosphatase